MRGIAEFFSRIRGLQAREAAFCLAVQQALKKQLSLDVPLEAISYKGAAVILKGIDQAARSALFIKKAGILDEINASQPIRTIKDIR